MKYLNETVCDDRIIRCDADGGFKPGRQYGRGKSGGQVRDERRRDIDLARGGVQIIQPNAQNMTGEKRRRYDDENENTNDSVQDFQGRIGNSLSTSR